MLDVKTMIQVTSDFTNNGLEICTQTECEFYNVVDQCSISLNFETNQPLQSLNKTNYMNASFKNGEEQVLRMSGGTKLTINNKDKNEVNLMRN